MSITGNASTTNNITHCFVATGVRKISGQNLDRTEDLMISDQVKQSMMAAPLSWMQRYDIPFSRHDPSTMG